MTFDGTNLTVGGNVTAYSDVKIKKDIVTIADALNKVCSIRGVTFTRTDLASEIRQAGVIAQEVEKVLPEVVFESGVGIKHVAYGNIVGLLIEAIKELKAELDTLRNA